MENMINRIVEMDKKAKAITDAAGQERAAAEQDIARKAEEIRNEYLERARRRINLNGETERKLADEKWKVKEAAFTAQRETMDKLAAEKSAAWTDEIVGRVLAKASFL